MQLYLFRFSMSGNYGLAIKMMGQDKRQLISHIFTSRIFLPTLWAAFVTEKVKIGSNVSKVMRKQSYCKA